jgi:hypothetical protein
MLVKVIEGCIHGNGKKYFQGDVVSLSDRDAKRVIELGRAVPAREVITLGINTTSENDQAGSIDHVKG